jgi:hypothetical protein
MGEEGRVEEKVEGHKVQEGWRGENGKREGEERKKGHRKTSEGTRREERTEEG